MTRDGSTYHRNVVVIGKLLLWMTGCLQEEEHKMVFVMQTVRWTQYSIRCHSVLMQNYSALTYCFSLIPRPRLIHCCPSVNWRRYLGIKENTYLKLRMREERPAKDGNERICSYGNDLMLVKSKQTDHQNTTLWNNDSPGHMFRLPWGHHQADISNVLRNLHNMFVDVSLMGSNNVTEWTEFAVQVTVNRDKLVFRWPCIVINSYNKTK